MSQWVQGRVLFIRSSLTSFLKNVIEGFSRTSGGQGAPDSRGQSGESSVVGFHFPKFLRFQQ